MIRPVLGLGVLLAAVACETGHPVVVPLTPERVQHHWLPGIEDGKTTLASATAALGAPLSFEGGGVGIWRLLLVLDPTFPDDDALDAELDEIAYLWWNPYDPYRPVNMAGVAERRERLFENGAMVTAGAAPPPGFARHALLREAEFHLVAAFGPDGVLRRHSFVRVGP
ncbi:MAG: hypothetical protein MUE73_18560 [Planctomycetes bacterium]|jgi:hypothetical protein|nr:hypothetical protein [Planctomycetota bacterium]